MGSMLGDATLIWCWSKKLDSRAFASDTQAQTGTQLDTQTHWYTSGPCLHDGLKVAYLAQQ